MPKVKSPASMWCLLRDDRRLREAIRYQLIKRYGSIYKAAIALDIKGHKFSKYFNYRLGKSRGFTQFEILQLCERLGIEISLQIKQVK